jgi:hypothetical protein
VLRPSRSLEEIISLCYFPISPPSTTFRFSKPTHSEHAYQIRLPSPDAGSSCFSQSGTFFRPSVQGQYPHQNWLGTAGVWAIGEARQHTCFGVVGGEWWNINVLGAYSFVALSFNDQALAVRLPTPLYSYFWIYGTARNIVSGMTYV